MGRKKPAAARLEEGDDIDRILAEIGGADPVMNQVAPASGREVLEEVGAGTDQAEGSRLSKNAMKRKKRKDKEKENKVEEMADVESKGPEKKVSKAIRAMQETLAQIAEAKEKEKREEEERLREEEEENLRLEEQKRQADEKKRIENEKRSKKKQEKKQRGQEETRDMNLRRLLANARGRELPTRESTTIKEEILVKEERATKSSDISVQSGQNLRSPICCIMGHVDAGKTKLLDCIRGTSVQGGEAGGITQQIGATYIPAKNIRDLSKELKEGARLNVPGLLVIDTPGHESFTNLRSRGAGLCDIAVLVVDIMHGLKPQTIESLNLLKMRNTEFIVALNKVDSLYGWKTCRNAPIAKAMEQQEKDVIIRFNQQLEHVKTQFKEQSLNTELYYKNKEMGQTFSIVPTSAISGEGIPDLLLLLVQWAQKTMVERLTFNNQVQCTVLEVKVVEGHGTTIDVVLVNGILHRGDQIVACGLEGPIVTTIRTLLTPHPMKELRVKGDYLRHEGIMAAQGVKITAQGLEHAIAGTSLYVLGPNDDLEAMKELVMEDMKSVMSRINKSGDGVYVQASTLGSLEALLEEFSKSGIPVSGFSIGPVHKKDVMKASVMLEKHKEYGIILAFDVQVTKDINMFAGKLGVKIFTDDIIYHLVDQFSAYIDNIRGENKSEVAKVAVFPCVLKITHVFRKKDPVVLGVDVLEGIAKVGTPICVPQKEFIGIGQIASIENNERSVDYARRGQQVAIKIIGSNTEEQQKMFGRHFDIKDELVSKISRESLDALKEHYAKEVSKEEVKLLGKLKRLFKIH